jgi:hypothetical protein
LEARTWPPSRLINRQVYDCRLDFRRDAILQDRLLACAFQAIVITNFSAS